MGRSQHWTLQEKTSSLRHMEGDWIFGRKVGVRCNAYKRARRGRNAKEAAYDHVIKP